MKEQINWLANTPTNGAKQIIILRLMAGCVFFWEGILKFVYVNQGVGRFTKLGFPEPVFIAHFVGIAEIIGGLFLIFGLMTRLVSLYFILEMIVAILSTKITLYLGTYPLPLPPAPPKVGIWAVLHEGRSDYAQLLTCVFLMLVGPGILSLDEWIAKRKRKELVQ
jgi:putative oxidoreductase